MIGKLLLMGCGVALCAVAFGDGDLATSRHPRTHASKSSLQTMLIMHAGKGNGAPENTLPAFKAAVAAGFGFECDIQMSADHQIFAAHNGSALAYSGKDIAFKSMPWSEIEKIDVGRRLGGEAWAGTPPPRFEDILALMRDGRVSYVEVKETAGTEIVPYIKKAVESQSIATPKNMAFISFDKAICRALREAMPEYEVLWLTVSCKEPIPGGPPIQVDELIASIKEANATGVDISIDMRLLTKEYIQKVKDAGFSFSVWTVDDTGQARVMLERGADTVTTNRAKEIAENLKNWKLPTR